MSLHYWAFIYLSPGFDPETNTMESSSNSCRFKAIGIDVFKKELAIEVAQKLVAEGVQAIEVCGGFGPTWVAKITEAIGNKVPVGTVMYGPEFRKPLLDVMKFDQNAVQ